MDKVANVNVFRWMLKQIQKPTVFSFNFLHVSKAFIIVNLKEEVIKPLQTKHTENVWIFHDSKLSDQSHTPFWEVCLSQPHLKDSTLNLVVKWSEHCRSQTRWSNGLSWVLTLTICQMLLLYFKLGNRSEYQFTLRVVEKKKTVYFKIIFASYSSIIILMSLYRQESYFSWKSVIVHVHMYIFVSMDFFTKNPKAKTKWNTIEKKSFRENISDFL